MPRLMTLIRRLSALTLPLALSGCNLVVMSPSGDIAMQQRDLILVSVALMLLIIVPVICLTLYFAWHYRRSNTTAKYDPEWHHSTRLEVVIWSAPLAIIIALGAVTWVSTHQLDPYRPLDRIDSKRPVTAETKPITIEVVALDWKWLFLYPEQGIATVNEIAAPIDTPIEFKITGSTVMNSFYIPALAGQIYAMPGMQTKLHAVMNKEGVYEGFSANYSGDGFSGMRFKFHGLSNAAFGDWVSRVKSQGSALNRDAYLKLERPSSRVPVTYYATVENGLYDAILNLCVQPGQMCANEMMHIDKMGGAGVDSEENRKRLEYDTRWAAEAGPGATYPATGHGAKQGQEAEGVNAPAAAGDAGHDGHGAAPDQLNTNPKP
ncbi:MULTISPECIES: ubiquinol oxidase subunit II [Rhizobium]|uniref:Ubiquinol oxidase subunit 2 n=1 Tax=Rhizobium straminoryzae TaxID=1387186 RepID=A0A549TAC3_9HYPH|nr:MULTISPECIES: ubiquinol oxidase subunit II [Rhizobium]TRL38820.1 ubiquinol oxidase subunit II [Rhizobium straminoryzae]